MKKTAQKAQSEPSVATKAQPRSLLTEAEKQTVEWFKALSAEGASRLEAARLDHLGVLTLALKADHDTESGAWLGYVAAQAPARGAVVKEFIASHGVLVLILPRYAKAEQKNLTL